MSGEQPLNVEWTNVFKRDYKRAMKRNLDISLLDDIIGKLSRREKALGKGIRQGLAWRQGK